MKFTVLKSASTMRNLSEWTSKKLQKCFCQSCSWFRHPFHAVKISSDIARTIKNSQSRITKKKKSLRLVWLPAQRSCQEWHLFKTWLKRWTSTLIQRLCSTCFLAQLKEITVFLAMVSKNYCWQDHRSRKKKHQDKLYLIRWSKMEQILLMRHLELLVLQTWPSKLQLWNSV